MQAWVGQGRLAEAAGDFSGAIAAVQKVIDIFDARFASVELPPLNLFGARAFSRLLQKRAAQKAANP